MKHITIEYGQSRELIESTLAEFSIMREFLERHGIEARICSVQGERCTWQIRNGYKDWVHLNKDCKRCQQIIDTVETAIESGSWRR